MKVNPISESKNNLNELNYFQGLKNHINKENSFTAEIKQYDNLFDGMNEDLKGETLSFERLPEINCELNSRLCCAKNTISDLNRQVVE